MRETMACNSFSPALEQRKEILARIVIACVETDLARMMVASSFLRCAKIRVLMDLSPFGRTCQDLSAA
jgi:hypothetical protein